MWINDKACSWTSERTNSQCLPEWRIWTTRATQWSILEQPVRGKAPACDAVEDVDTEDKLEDISEDQSPTWSQIVKAQSAKIRWVLQKNQCSLKTKTRSQATTQAESRKYSSLQGELNSRGSWQMYCVCILPGSKIGRSEDLKTWRLWRLSIAS